MSEVVGLLYLVNEGGLGPYWVLEVLEAAKKLMENIGHMYL